MAGLAVVLDTNVPLSGLTYPASVPGRLIAAWRFGALEGVLSNFILAELRRPLPRLPHRHGLTPEAIDDLIDSLAIPAELVDGLIRPLAPSFPVAAPAPWRIHGCCWSPAAPRATRRRPRSRLRQREG